MRRERLDGRMDKVVLNSCNATSVVSEVGTYSVKQDPVLLVFFGVQHVVTVAVAEIDIEKSLAAAEAQNFLQLLPSFMRCAFDVSSPLSAWASKRACSFRQL